jgi:tRNA pseudouridine38-40 synthase
VASFHTKSALSAPEFQRALNALLPPAIRIVASAEVGPAFHARWSATSKHYCYRLYRGKVVPPPVWRYVLHYPFPLDEQAMQDAALRFIGTHDFTSFAASTGSEDDDKERNLVREIYSAEVKRVAEELHFNVHGQSFLRYMVRKMMGALLEVGRGRMTADDIDRLYEWKDRSKSGPTAPPEGLCMVRVEHDEGWRIGNP